MTQLRLTTATLTALGGIGLLINDMGLALLGAGFGTLGVVFIIQRHMKGES